MPTLNWRGKYIIHDHRLDTPSYHSPKRRPYGVPVPEPLPPLWAQDRNVQSEDDLLLELKGRVICSKIKNVHFIGAHLFQEQEVLRKLFPNVHRIYLYEPIPELYHQLCDKLSSDPGIQVFPYAISDNDGTALFHLASNNGASSSLLHMGKHLEIFPHVQELESILVQTRRLETVIKDHGLELPDLLFVDVQGAEYQVLSSLTPGILKNISMIYTEASTEPIYEGSRTLQDLRELLIPGFLFAGFVPLTNEIRVHGNALFIRSDLGNQLKYENATLADVARLSDRIDSTISGLSSMQSELSALRAELSTTRIDLNVSLAELSATRIDLSATLTELSFTQIELGAVRAELLATREKNLLINSKIERLDRKRISYKLQKVRKTVVQNLKYISKKYF